ncbi:MAG: primase-helicase family protein [Candidatus Electronema sp. V4]|uniref:primase-helicase family protein n=1 Tax=Candidatus Electronema sp. V4 TaxID=3454756 RepID=UPI0040559109
MNHIYLLVEDKTHAETIFDWFAYLIQEPQERPMFSLLITSEVRGCGKDTITDIFSKMLGNYCKSVSIPQLIKEDGFGNIFHHSKLLVCSECGCDSANRCKISDTVNDLITKKSKSINLKYGDIIDSNMLFGMVFLSNHKRPFEMDKTDRRFFVTSCY